LKEKVLAAKQAGIKMIIAPEKNQKDLIEIPDDAKEGLDFVFVNQIDQVFKKAL
jgi:ATP-dependent Lon protease